MLQLTFIFLILSSSVSFGLPRLIDFTTDTSYNSKSLFVDGIEYPALSYIQSPVPYDEELTFEQLTEVMAEKKLNTIESVISNLPEYMLNYNYIVMYRSRSLQKASLEAPRIITFTPTARLILSFNGGGSLKGGQAIEVIRFDDQTRRFEFREITFSHSKPPTISEPNPKKCLGCHQSPSRTNIDMRPNWEPYNVWPGAIGSNNGIVTSPLKNDGGVKAVARPHDSVFLEEQVFEKDILDHFLQKVAPNNPRYSSLGILNPKTPTHFTQVIAVLNFQRVVRLMAEETPIWEAQKEIYEMLGRCHYSYDLKEESFSRLLENHRLLTPAGRYISSGAFGEEKISQRITWLFESLGVDTSDWSMDFGTTGRFAFMERFGVPHHTHMAFEAAWRKSFSESELSCQDLAKLAKSKLQQLFKNKPTWTSSSPLQLEISAPKLLKQCSGCHSDGITAPLIPFNDPQKLKVALHSPYKKQSLLEEILERTGDMAEIDNQMPPNRRLHFEEREALRKYLEAL